MEMTRISIPLTVEEREALRISAQHELRDPRDHARYLLRALLLRDQAANANDDTTQQGLRVAVAVGK